LGKKVKFKELVNASAVLVKEPTTVLQELQKGHTAINLTKIHFSMAEVSYQRIFSIMFQRKLLH